MNKIFIASSETARLNDSYHRISFGSSAKIQTLNLLQSVIQNTFYNINAQINTLMLKTTTQTYNIILPSGFYTANKLLVLLQQQIQIQTVGAVAMAGVFDQITAKCTLTFNVPVQLITARAFHNNILFNYLGLSKTNSGLTNFQTVITADNPMNVLVSSNFYFEVVNQSCSNKQQQGNYICSMPNKVAFGGILEQQYDVGQNVIKFPSIHAINELTIAVYGDNRLPLYLHDTQEFSLYFSYE